MNFDYIPVSQPFPITEIRPTLVYLAASRLTDRERIDLIINAPLKEPFFKRYRKNPPRPDFCGLQIVQTDGIEGGYLVSGFQAIRFL